MAKRVNPMLAKWNPAWGPRPTHIGNRSHAAGKRVGFAAGFSVGVCVAVLVASLILAAS